MGEVTEILMGLPASVRDRALADLLDIRGRIIANTPPHIGAKEAGAALVLLARRAEIEKIS